MEDCDLCGRGCHVNRMETMVGVACRSGPQAGVASSGLHYGEEDPIRGIRGSGMITLIVGSCSLRKRPVPVMVPPVLPLATK